MHKSITMEPVMKGVWEILLNPPGWSIIPAMIIGLVLIWIDARRTARHRAKDAPESRKQLEYIDLKKDARNCAADRAKAAAEAAAQRAIDEANARAERAEREKLEAIEAEKRRAAAEKAEIERARLQKEDDDRRRAADTAHRSKINGEILHKLADFIDRYRPVTGQQPVLGQQLTGELARALVIAIARNEIPHVTISY
jgi:colicin import membrane protein